MAELLSAALNFTLGFSAVLVAFDVLLTGRGLGHTKGDQRQETGGRHNKTEKHPVLATLAQLRRFRA